MVISKKRDDSVIFTVNGIQLEQVQQYKYTLDSIITDNGRCEQEMKTRIAVAKEAFWQHKELFRGNLKLATKKRPLYCYVFSVLKYGRGSWILNKTLIKRIDAFEQRCYRRILEISWKDRGYQMSRCDTEWEKRRYISGK